MRPFGSILCPVDFSAHAGHALRHAAALAGLTGARLTVAWVADPLLERVATEYVLDPDHQQAFADLGEFVTATLPPGTRQGPEPKLVMAVGQPETEIARIAAENQADLVVMGTQGLSGYRKKLLGSTTERVLRHATVPVLAVRLSEGRTVLRNGDRPGLDVGTVVIAIDLGTDSPALAEFGAGLAQLLQAPAVFVHAVPQASAPARWRQAVEARQQSSLESAREELSRLTATAGITAAECVVAAGNPAEEIAGLAEARQAGLIVMGLIGGPGRLGARPGSIAYRVLLLAATSVLVVPPNALNTAS
jgi:nucleotide-binding universal stress UspA family protein